MKFVLIMTFLFSTAVMAKKAGLDQFTKEMQKELSVLSENPHLYETKPIRKPASVDPLDINSAKKVEQLEEDYNYIENNRKW